jgi:hypothetical protein
MKTLDEIQKILHDNKDNWLLGTHQGNDGNQGNTLEGLLGVAENNLKLPDLGEFELKTQKVETGSLMTLFHKEPKPRASIPRLIKCLGWKHQKEGKNYRDDEMSFRSTTYAHRYSDRGFSIELTNNRIEFRFDPSKVNFKARDLTGMYPTYGDWLNDVEKRKPNYRDVLPVYWDRSEFETECMKKANNTIACYFETRRIDGKEHFKIVEAFIYKNFIGSRLSELFENGSVVIDFDARTRHNHGTKLRAKKSVFGKLFEFSTQLL